MRLKWGFDEARDGFRYEDDLFRFTSEASYAKGTHTKNGGRDGGGLSLMLGGRDDLDVGGMSGGWTKAFSLDEAQTVTLTFRFKMQQDADYSTRQFTEIRAALDGDRLGLDGEPYVARLYGDGSGGGKNGTGWRKVTIELGELEAGRHEFSLGGFGNGKSGFVKTRISFDDVELRGDPAAKPAKTVKLGAFEAEVLELTNDFRERHGLDPVRAEANLTAAAENWSREMAKGDFFRHSSLPGQINDHGYDARGYGENIAAGYPDPEAVVDGWINSPGHRKNLLRDDFEHIGIGHHYQKGDGGAAPYGHYWTQIFGDPSNDYFG